MTLKIRITDLFKLHGLENTRNTYQIFCSERGQVKQSLVLNKEELKELHSEIDRMLKEENDSA